MAKIVRFLSGDVVREATLRLLNAGFERWFEPRYRRRAWRGGFGVGYEAWLIVLRSEGKIMHASLRAFKLAKSRVKPNP